MSELTDEFARRRQRGVDIESCLIALREQGGNQIDGVKALVAVEGLPLGEAKDVVDASAAWAHLLPATRVVRHVTLEAAEQLARETRHRS